MKVAGVIAEYNPFHNGHQYHLEQTRKLTGADYIVVIMSGDFVQRGGPAITDKYLRAKSALENGADLVIQMPVTGSTLSAGEYAKCGVETLSRLGIVTDISFGCEAKNAAEQQLLIKTAGFLHDESKAFQSILAEGIRRGLTFPAARANALCSFWEREPGLQNTLQTVLASPNNILALEYLHANLETDHPMEPCMVTRAGAAYHEQSLSDTASFPSATAIRQRLFEQYSDSGKTERSDDILTGYIPSSSNQELTEYLASHRPLSEDDFSDMLFYALRSQKDTLSERFSQNVELSNTIKNKLEAFSDWKTFALSCKGKNQTLTAVNRYLTHIFLGIDAAMLSKMRKSGFAPYARVLGFHRDAAPLLSKMNEAATIPVITHPAQALRDMDADPASLFRLDLASAELYSYAADPDHNAHSSELRHPLVYL